MYQLVFFNPHLGANALNVISSPGFAALRQAQVALRRAGYAARLFGKDKRLIPLSARGE